MKTTKLERVALRNLIRQRKIRRAFILLTVNHAMPSADAVRFLAEKFSYSESHMFRIIRPADVRAMLEHDWEATMTEYKLSIPKPAPVEFDSLEGGEI
jgi:hypothetical protein